jgi:hypothetical protein
MGDYAKRYAQNLKDARAQGALDKESAAKREEDRLTYGPIIWERLRDWIQKTCQEINEGMGEKHFQFDKTGSNELKIKTSSPPAHLELEFDPPSHRIRYECGASKNEYIIDVDPSGEPFLTDAYHRTFEVESTGQFILDELAKSQF